MKALAGMVVILRINQPIFGWTRRTLTKCEPLPAPSEGHVCPTQLSDSGNLCSIGNLMIHRATALCIAVALDMLPGEAHVCP